MAELGLVRRGGKENQEIRRVKGRQKGQVTKMAGLYREELPGEVSPALEISTQDLILV